MTDVTTPARRRTSWGWLAAAVLLVVTACGGEADQGDAGEPVVEEPQEPTTTELAMPSTQSGRCMQPNVDNLRTQDVAFEGTVIAVDGQEATLEVAEWFKGEETDQVVVTSPSDGLADLGLGVDFELGATYLVSATDGQVSVCGLSGPAEEPLEELYEEAYEG